MKVGLLGPLRRDEDFFCVVSSRQIDQCREIKALRANWDSTTTDDDKSALHVMAPPSRPPSPLPSLLLPLLLLAVLLSSASAPGPEDTQAREVLPGGDIAERAGAYRRVVRHECPPDGDDGDYQSASSCVEGEARGVRPRGEVDGAGAASCGGDDGDGSERRRHGPTLREGTVVYVARDGGQTGLDWAEGGSEEADAASAGDPCLERMGGMYDGDEGVVQYELLERVPYELGNVDNHREDYVSLVFVARAKHTVLSTPGKHYRETET